MYTSLKSYAAYRVPQKHPHEIERRHLPASAASAGTANDCAAVGRASDGRVARTAAHCAHALDAAASCDDAAISAAITTADIAAATTTTTTTAIDGSTTDAGDTGAGRVHASRQSG